MLTEVWPFVDEKRRSGRHVVLARLIDRDGPGSRPLGATMAVASDGTWRGSVSGGCVEGTLLDETRAVLDGAPPHLTSVSPGHHLMPWEEAPSCAGALSVLITPAPPEPIHAAITTALATNAPLALRIDLRAPFSWSLVSDPDTVSGNSAAFVEQLRPRPRLVLVGATDLAAVLATLAVPLQRNVIVLEPRPDHARPDQFPAATTVIRSWPDQWLSGHPARSPGRGPCPHPRPTHR
jgi:xanthine dehydrogenase accessory factor